MEGELVMVERISRIYYEGKYYQVSAWQIGDVVKNAGPMTIVAGGLRFMWAAVRYAVFNEPIRNMKDAYTAQFGSTLYEMFFRRYTEKVWGKPLRGAVRRLGRPTKQGPVDLDGRCGKRCRPQEPRCKA